MSHRQAGEFDEDPETVARTHSRFLRELMWLPNKERAKFCARCTLIKKSILTLSYKSERFGLCARCLETLWSEVGHDE